MIAYVGQGRITKGCSVVATLERHGIGMCVCPGEKLPPVVRPAFLDNGAFRDWDNGRPWNAPLFESFVEESVARDVRPDFLVAPDLVTQGRESLAFSLAWAPRLREVAPLFLAVQDGMCEGDVSRVIRDGWAGLFVGGSLEWKLATGGAWVALAHDHGLRCHVGRIGTPDRVRWARAVGADSIDSSAPLWTAEKLAAWIAAVGAASRGADTAWTRAEQGGLFA